MMINNSALKMYVSFDHNNDQPYFSLMKSWKNIIDKNISFENELNQVHGNIKASMIHAILSSSVFVLFVGEKTRFINTIINLEIAKALDNNMPIICMNLNGKRSLDFDRCPQNLQNSLALHISFNADIFKKAISDWSIRHYQYMESNIKGDFYYNDNLYQSSHK